MTSAGLKNLDICLLFPGHLSSPGSDLTHKGSQSKIYRQPVIVGSKPAVMTVLPSFFFMANAMLTVKGRKDCCELHPNKNRVGDPFDVMHNYNIICTRRLSAQSPKE